MEFLVENYLKLLEKFECNKNAVTTKKYCERQIKIFNVSS